MSCEETKHLLQDLALGEGVSEQAAIHQHLASCPACRAELADLELTRKLLLQGLPEEEPPRRIAFVAERQVSRQRFWRWAFAASTALALVLAALAVRRPAAPAAATFTRAEVEQIAQAVARRAVEESVRRQRAETVALVNGAAARLVDQMRYFERTQTIFYKQAERNRTDLDYIAALIGRSDVPAGRREGEPPR